MSKSKEHVHVGDQVTKSEALLRLKRIEGQIRGISGMVEKNAYCQDILNQIASVRQALAGLQQLIFHEHVENCIADRMVKDKNGATNEIIAILRSIR